MYTPVPPSNSSDLPSFCRPEYLEAMEDLANVWDVWNGLKGVKERYVQQEAKEPPEAYRDRLNRCAFDNRFSPAIAGYAGLLSDFTLTEDIAPSIQEAQDNIDLQGNDLHTFWQECDTLALRDGGCAVLVDYPQFDESIQNNADFLASSRRPYLVAVDRRDILNWHIEYLNGVSTIHRVTIQERRLVPDGLFGIKQETYYRVLVPGAWNTYQIIESGGKWRPVEVESGTTSLDVVPLIWYSVSDSKPMLGKPPFLGLAELNIEHHQKRSQLNEILRKCNLPVPVREGMIKTPMDLKNAPSMILGPNSFQDIPTGGKIYFAEPSGVAIAATQSDLDKLEAAMDRLSLGFLTGGEAQRTATEVVLDSAQIQASLRGTARRKASAMQVAFELWSQYTGEQSSGGVEMNDSILQVPISPEQINRLQSLADKRYLSHATLLRELQAGKAISRSIDVDAEVASPVMVQPSSGES